MRHANLSIFVPHLGCPNQCSFCNQRSISGAQSMPDGNSVVQLCRAGEQQLKDRCSDAEIAFFGGSFTAIDRDYMLELLEAAAPFTQGGVFKGIRISTRPDCIDEEILELLARFHVSAIELGAQSMSDRVLEMNQRGHSALDVERSAKLICAYGFELGLQMMTGLYGSDDRIDMETARRLATLSPKTVRIYPTIVMDGTLLADLYRMGKYQPQTLEGAIALGAKLLKFFSTQDIPVIRMGLHAQDTLETAMLAGPYHPAYRELCEGKWMRDQAFSLLDGKPKGDYILHVAKKSVSKITGHGARTIDDLGKLGYNIRIKQDSGLTGLTLEIREV
ncbi:radical SAM protein [Oscillospiraceae bacterium PP1C4]